MKKLINPGFEFAFALGLIAIFALPPIVMAQEHKELNVTITNSDTTINGKNIKELPAGERKDALKKLNNLNSDFNLKIDSEKDSAKRFTLRMRTNGDKSQDIIMQKRGGLDEIIATIPDMEKSFRFETADSAGKVELRKLFKGDDMMPDMNFRFEPKYPGNDFPQVFTYNSPRAGITRMNRKNTQSFNYAYTDKDGISTHINFNAGDASAENVKRITGNEKADLEIKDLNITPLFSSGKTNISFSLPVAGYAEITLKNTEGKVIWTEKTSSVNFAKSFDMPQNGVYYLQVKQGAKIGLKRITKEE
ncbi:T9SS type A sorting domain-containing protein [Mucilaginibacter sp. HMF5004]|uniref:T9SS type A sorting domain-containing protein n=1 Tax=Mucilaginibacter rivuli TaxID=2857527 RepID=UPI001C5CF4F2|nr:T9SS type A sorting domain-containing protein [Mucilaginibacter rivuli]MBW4888219.1 T9SS type A sorting domain-containing protein [Mucilaginibacter rivuli]